MATTFTSDRDFQHVRILGIAGRLFGSVFAPDQALNRTWNEVVTPADEVWRVGDPARIETALRRPSGQKDQILGNHDDEAVQTLPWASVSTITETVVDGRSIPLRHDSMWTWRSARRGAIHVHGQMHGFLRNTSLSLDVDVDCWSFRPSTRRDTRQWLLTLPPDPEFHGLAGARR